MDRRAGLPITDVDATRIILVQNDELFRQHLKKLMLGGAEIVDIYTEHSFRERIEEWKYQPPSLFILGCNLSWTDPAPKQPEPPNEVIEGGPYDAGFRMAKILSENPPLDKVPVIITCVHSRHKLDLSALPRNVARYGFRESGDFVNEINRLINQ